MISTEGIPAEFMPDGTVQLRIEPEGFFVHPHLAPGVIGYTRDAEDGTLLIPLIYSEIEGQGNVGRYLNSLPPDRRVCIPNVVNPILALMLWRRGFAPGYEEVAGEAMEVWVREPCTTSNTSG